MEGAERLEDRADLWADVAPPAARRLLLAGLDAFSELGYFATTTREIAQRAGMSPAAVYVHYPSKAELLAQICLRGHDQVLSDVERAAAGTQPAAQRIGEFVFAFSAFHARNHTLGRVMQYELRGLEPDRFREVARLRERFELLIVDLLREGSASGAFPLEDADATGVTILSLGIDVARWYGSVSDKMTAEDVGTLHRTLVLRMLGAPAK